jgi:PAS domain S-box-containing protein
MNKPTRILIVEDLAVDADLATRAIRKVLKDCEIQVVETRKDFLHGLEVFQPDVILSDYSLPRFDGMQALKLALKHAPLTPLIIWTGSISEDVAVACMKAGANNYVLKGNFKRLGPAVLHALEEREVLVERRQAEARINDLLEFNAKILNNSPLGIITYKLTGECIYANENAAAIVGTQIEQLQAQNFHTIESWKRSGLYDLVQQAITTQRPLTRDIHVVSTFGKDIWMTVHCVTFQSKGEEHLLLSISEITERKRAEEALRESENRLILALSGAQMSVWEWNLQTNQILWSPEIFEITGVKENDLGGTFKSFTHLIHADDIVHVMAAAQKAMNEGTLFAEEFRIIRPDGEIRWLSNLGHAEYDAKQDYLRLIGTVQDITQRKQAEIERQALLEIMQGFAITKDLRELLKLIHHSIAQVIDAENFFVALYQPNSGLFEEIYSVDQYDLPGPPSRLEKSLTSYVFGSGKPLLLTQMQFAEMIARDEVRLVGTNSASWLGVPLKTSERVIGVMAVQDYENPERYSERDRDFMESIATQVAMAIEHKEAGLALRESEEHYRAIFEGVQDAIFVESIDGRVLMVNERACEMFGYSRAEFVTKTVADLVPKDCPIITAEEIDAIQPLAPRVTFNQRANGEIFPIEISGRLQVINDETMLLVVVRDITERKRAEAALMESITRFRTLFEASPDAILLLDPADNWSIVDCNTSTCQMNGYSREELIGQSIDILNVAPNKPFERTEYLEKIRGQDILRYETTHRRKDGSIIAVEVSTSLIRFGKRDIVLGIDRDITERKKSEMEVRRHVADLEALYENGLAVGRLLEPDKIGNRVIETFARYLPWHHVTIRLRRGNSDELELVAFNLPNLKDEERADAQQHFIANINKVGQGLSGWVIQTGLPLRTGNVRSYPQYIETHAEIQSGLYLPLKAGEDVIGVISVESRAPDAFTEQDERLLATLANQAAIAFENARLYEAVQKELAERKRAEEALQLSETHYRELADSITDILFELDQDLHYIHWNKASELLLDVPAEQAIGKSLREIFGETEQQARVEQVFEEVLRDHQPRTFEITFTLNEEWRSYEISAYPSRRGVSVVAKDVTERKQMEAMLADERNQLAQRVEERTADLSRANSNLARALRVKDEFLANMSHELRTPLNAILGLSESLGEQIAGPLNEKQQKYTTTISESGHHLLSLINDILDLAKIDAGQITLDINKVDVHSVCQASLRMIKQLAQKKNQEVTLEIDQGLGVMWADERRLKQMIVNLLGNAVKFTPESGKLGLEVHADEGANKITITVWDTGIGIKENDLARLFQPFVQLDSGLAREATGTGLGLALVAQMARLHGGSVSAVSEPEKGSRFSIVLPWEPSLVMDAAARMRITGKFRAIKTDSLTKPTILLVEDTQEVTMMIRDYLELAGYKVVTAQDGVDALVQARLARPDLILMDVQMPRMDGLEATRKLRNDPDFRFTPIIALTALAMSNDRERCLAAGMDEYLSKPINLKALVKVIQDCLFDREESKPR